MRESNMLLTMVGATCSMSSAASFFSRVVLPALSSPSSKIRNSFCDLRRRFLNILSKPCEVEDAH